jgi:hypothetical protein
MAHWIFQGNPKYYDFDRRRQCSPPEITWLVTRYANEIGRDDIAFVFIGGKEPGIRGVLKITRYPDMMPERPHELQYYKVPPGGTEMRVLATITNATVSIPEALLRATPGLEKLSILQGQRQGTNFKVTPAEARIINRLIEAQAAQSGRPNQSTDTTA